ncbi:hypothetical protein B0H14DRAFT_3166653 [Mycena olivaceomarginata]|nr:hypothetical protein B0H14DRAFT_3166653 [Mycena olivaceomarginata]
MPTILFCNSLILSLCRCSRTVLPHGVQSRRRTGRSQHPFNTACLAAAAKVTAAFVSFSSAVTTYCMYPMRAAQFDATDPANNAQGNTNSANANGTTAKGANPVATNNKAAGAGSPAAVGPRVSAYATSTEQ